MAQHRISSHHHKKGTNKTFEALEGQTGETFLNLPTNNFCGQEIIRGVRVELILLLVANR